MKSRIWGNLYLVISLFLVLIIPAMLLIYYFQPVVVEGVVDHKTLVGVKDGVVKTLLVVIPNGVVIKDELVKS